MNMSKSELASANLKITLEMRSVIVYNHVYQKRRRNGRPGDKIKHKIH